MSEPHIGKVVDGRYRLDRLLGEGEAGAVYAATQLSVDRTVAVKLLHAANSDRFTAEARAIAKLNHTNVITLHDFGFDSEIGAHFMVTEYADGIPLSERMQEVMGTDLIMRVSLEIASALHHAHANGVLHRDLKPENVILARADGRVDVAKVLDFGLAHLMDDSAESMPPGSELADTPPALDPEDSLRTSEVGRPVPDTDDYDRDPAPDEEPPASTQVDVEPPAAVLAEASDLLADDDEVDETTRMSATTLTELDANEPDGAGTAHVPADDEHDTVDRPVLETAKMPVFRASAQRDAFDDATKPIAETEELPREDEADETAISSEHDLRKNLLEDSTATSADGESKIVTAQELELETAVLPAMDLSHDSPFEEEE